MTSKYTAAPWKYIERSAQRGPQIINNNHRICLMWNQEVEGEMEENARLIAAAPDLLKALKNAVELIQMCEYAGESIRESNYADALEAIAKAEGVSNV